MSIILLRFDRKLVSICCCNGLNIYCAKDREVVVLLLTALYTLMYVVPMFLCYVYNVLKCLLTIFALMLWVLIFAS